MIRRELIWALGGTLILVAVAIGWEPETPEPARGAEPASKPLAQSNRLEPADRVTPEDGRLAPALVDVFAVPPDGRPHALKTAAQAPAVTAPAPLAAPVMAAAPPVPSAPRLAGRVLTPEGQLIVYLRDGEQTLLAAAGTTLPSGYVVEAVLSDVGTQSAAAGRVRLLHAATGQRVSLVLDPPRP